MFNREKEKLKESTVSLGLFLVDQPMLITMSPYEAWFLSGICVVGQLVHHHFSIRFCIGVVLELEFSDLRLIARVMWIDVHGKLFYFV